MLKRLRDLKHLAFQHRYGFTLVAFLVAAVVTGAACVLFMWAFDFVVRHRLDFHSAGAWCWLTTPLVFLLSVQLIRRVAPAADGAGIPQTIFAAGNANAATEGNLAPLTSGLTMAVKIAALLAGLWAGASTGREGPTVHVAACVFVGVMLLLRRWTGMHFDMRSAIVAGGSAGLAAAFNTPLAGVTFAIEELSRDYFANIKDFVLLAIIIAGMTAKSLTGEYSYFGKLLDPSALPLTAILLIGLAGGLLGSLFSTALIQGKKMLTPFEKGRFGFLLPVVLSCFLLILVLFTGLRVLGPGNHDAQMLVSGVYASWVPFFPFVKMASTLLTYWSGIAGGIFAPSLAMGAGVGSSLGHWLDAPTASCALIGMAAFLSGTIQAPITAFVIIFEMTGNHQMLLPVMLSSLLAFMTARVLGAKHLYQALAKNYEYLLSPRHVPKIKSSLS